MHYKCSSILPAWRFLLPKKIVTMPLFQKFIIEDGCLIMMNVVYHSQIVTQQDKVKGGGWFLMNQLSNIYTFYGDSKDYGKAAVEDIRACIKNGKVFFSACKTINISGKHHFCYDTGTEVIVLCRAEDDPNSLVSTILRDARNHLYRPIKNLNKLLSFSKS